MFDPATGAFVGGVAGAAVSNILKGSPASAASSDALINSIAELKDAVERLISAMSNQQDEGGSNPQPGLMFAFPPNPAKILTQVIVPGAPMVAERLPDIVIPPNMAIVIKAFVGNFGLVYVGKTKTEAENVNVAYAMIFNEAISYKVSNANQIWVAAALLGEGVHITVEQGG
jgi:hypothetical protein